MAIYLPPTLIIHYSSAGGKQAKTHSQITARTACKNYFLLLPLKKIRALQRLSFQKSFLEERPQLITLTSFLYAERNRFAFITHTHRGRGTVLFLIVTNRLNVKCAHANCHQAKRWFVWLCSSISLQCSLKTLTVCYQSATRRWGCCSAFIVLTCPNILINLHLFGQSVSALTLLSGHVLWPLSNLWPKYTQVLLYQIDQ